MKSQRAISALIGRTLAASVVAAGLVTFGAQAGPASAYAGVWELIDSNPSTSAIAAGENVLAQLHDTGRIYIYTGAPPAWQMIDTNPATRKVVTSASNIYQKHADGKIWKYLGTPITGWQLVDANPATVDIVASGNDLYQRHADGKIWKYLGTPITGWQLVDANPATVDIVASGNNLYQRHADGKIWKYLGTPITGWQLLDANPATAQIVADGNDLYQRHWDGKIWKYLGTPITGWQLIDANPATRKIAAAAGVLSQMHQDGKIWRYLGTPIGGWQLVDANPATMDIAIGGSFLYQIHRDHKVWRFSLGRRMTTFQPAIHGFKFANTFVSEPISGIRFGGLCGGMSYAALDYYFNSIRIPQQTTLPPNGSVLQSYIYNRQLNSIFDNVDKWAELGFNPFGWRTQEFFNWGLQDYGGGRLQELRWLIDAGRPAPLGLFAAGNGGITPHHQVVAIGYDLGRYRGDLGAFREDLKIFIYDPNFPNRIQTLVPSVATTSYHYVDHPEKSWMTYFVDRKYQVHNPPVSRLSR